jgi:hypothetical protein
MIYGKVQKSLSMMEKISLLYIALTGIFFYLGRAYPTLVEAWARGPYLWFAPKISLLTSKASFSLTLPSLAIVIILCIALPVIKFLKDSKRQGMMNRIFRSSVCMVLFVGNFFCLYFWLWGFNYLRTPLQGDFVLDEMDDSEFQTIMRNFAETANHLRSGLAENQYGCIDGIEDLSELDRKIEPLQNQVLQAFGLPTMTGSRTKQQLFSNIWLNIGSAGIFGPFTFERNVSWPPAPGTQAVLVAHERSHFAGIANESLADFIGILTVWHSEEKLIQYSGWLRFWDLASGRNGIQYPLSAAVIRDLQCHKDFWNKQLGNGSNVAAKTWNNLLKAQGVSEGINSYREAVRLLVLYKRSQAV